MNEPSAAEPEGAAVFDLLASKLARPAVRQGIVTRNRLLDRLAHPGAESIISVVAPAGYGKTTLLAQWAERDRRPFAWVSLDELDNDPKIMLRYVAEALNRVEPLSHRVFDALASPSSSVPGSVLPRVGAAFAAMTRPVVLVLDDVHLLHDQLARSALITLADHVPDGSRLVLAGRTEPPLRIPRLRAEGRVLELGADDLALTRKEAALLLQGADVRLSNDEVAELHRRTEGWAVGLSLAALSLREGGSRLPPVGFAGSDRFVDEYVESELLAQVSPDQRTFLTRLAALDRMSAALCEAVLELPGAARSFEALTRSHLLLVPLDREGRWFRYHHLFLDVLRAELVRVEPDLLPVLRRRAAAWYLRNGLPEEAIEYAILADDVDTVAQLVQELWSPLYRRGQTGTLRRWFAWLDSRHAIERRPLNAMNAAFLAITTGRPAMAERWIAAVDRWHADVHEDHSDPYVEGMAATLRAMIQREGADRMREDADEAARLFSSAGFRHAITLLLQASARMLHGDLDEPATLLADAELIESQSPDVMAMVRVQRAVIAIAHHDWAAARTLVQRALASLHEAGVDDSYAAAFAHALRARIQQHGGDVVGARESLATAVRLRPILTYLTPDRAVQCGLIIVRVQLALDDACGAQTVMREVDDILRRRPGLGILVEEASELRDRLGALVGRAPGGATSLTNAELRVLPMLATHLTYSEIASELFLSTNTVKSQAYSVFRKLGASSRHEAVLRSRELALLEE